MSTTVATLSHPIGMIESDVEVSVLDSSVVDSLGEDGSVEDIGSGVTEQLG